MPETQAKPGSGLSTSSWLPAAADTRGNVIRIASIAGFYAIHLLNVYLPAAESSTIREMAGLSPSAVPTTVHLAVSIIVFGWLMQALALHAANMAGKVTDQMALVVSAGDTVWLTAVLCFSTGASGPMVAAYFLIIALSGLRLNLWLIRWTTTISAMGYLFVLGATRWPVGVLREIGLSPVPRYHQLMVVVAIIFCGVIVGQIVRLGWGVVATRSKLAGGARDE